MELSNYSKIFKALSNEQRLKIFMMIYQNCCGTGDELSGVRIKSEQCCVTEGVLEKAFTRVCECMKLSRSTISHHFKELQNAGLITCERKGQKYLCRVNEDAIDTLRNFLK